MTRIAVRCALLASGAMFWGTVFGGGSARAQQVNNTPDTSEEIVVTARFRAETAQNIGASITAIDGNALLDEGIEDFADIATRTPGLSIIDRGPSQNDVAIRGISNGVSPRLADLGSSGPLVSQFLDDLPVAAATASQRDFNYFDFDRIEILRGPQPTLFGEGSVGGTIRYFSRDPKLSGASISDMLFQSRVSFTHEGGTNIAASGATSFILVPDKLGIRIVGNYRRDDGFIDNPLLGLSNFNDYRAYSGRAVLLFKPDDALTIRLMAFAGNDDFSGANEVDAPPAPKDRLQFSTPVPGDNRDRFAMYSGRIEYDFGPLTVSSITGRYIRERRDRFFDAQSAAAFGLFTAPLAAVGASNSRDTSFTQELRFMSDFAGPLSLIGGLYYQRASYRSDLSTTAAEFAPFTLPVGGTTLIGQAGTVKSRQFSGFVEATLAASDRLRLIGGMRYVDERITSGSTQSIAAFGGGPLGLAPPFAIADVNAIAAALGFPLQERFRLKKFLPRASVEFDVSPAAMLYGTVATGVRNGNLNPFTSAFRGAGSPPDPARFAAARSFRDDEVLSFELGAKTRWLDGDLTLNLAAFHTRFRNPQILTSNPLVLTVNGPDIKITGFELQSNWRLWQGVNFYASAAYQDAAFQNGALLANPAALAALGRTEDLAAGSRPVNTPKWSFSTGLDLRRPLGGRTALIGNASYQYVGSRYSVSQNYPSSRMGALGLVNLRLGIDLGGLTIAGFVDNLTNDIEYQAIQGNLGTPILVNGALDFRPTSVAVNRPRTAGVDMTIRF